MSSRRTFFFCSVIMPLDSCNSGGWKHAQMRFSFADFLKNSVKYVIYFKGNPREETRVTAQHPAVKRSRAHCS